MSTFFENEFFLSNSWHFLVLLGVLTMFFHIPLMLGLNLTKKGWKKVDYMWLFIAVIGFMGGVSEVRGYVAKNYMEGERIIALSTLRSLKYQSLSVANSFWCSSNNEFRDSCKWFSEAAKYIDNIHSTDVSELIFKDYPELKPEDMFFGQLEHFKVTVLMYQEQRVKFIKTASVIEKSELELFFWYLSPFLLCFMLAIRITKVTGEVLLEVKT